LAPMLDAGFGAITLFTAILVAGLCSLIALCRAGIQIFWTDTDWVFPHARVGETVSVAGLLGLCLLLTFAAAAPWHYVTAAARQIHAPENYIEAVLAPTSADTS